MGFRSGEAQALLCEADILRLGGAGERSQALVASFDALGVFDGLAERFNEARAHQYVAVALAGEGREAEAVQFVGTCPGRRPRRPATSAWRPPC